MREYIFLGLSLAAAVILAALAALVRPESPLWKWLLWGGIGAFAAFAAVLCLEIVRSNSPRLCLAGVGLGTFIAITCLAASFGTPRKDTNYVFFSVDIRDPKNLAVSSLPLWINNASETTFEKVDPWFSPAEAKGNPYPRNESNPYWQYRNLKVFWPQLQSGSRLYGRDIPLSVRAWRIEIDSSFKGTSYTFLEFLEFREHDGQLIALIDVWRSIGHRPMKPVYSSPRPAGVIATWKP